MNISEMLYEEIKNTRAEIQALRKDINGLMWKVVSISAGTGGVGASLAIIIAHVLQYK